MSIKVKYLGDKAEGAVRAFGVTFEKGEAELDDRFAAKVEGNKFFEIVGGKPAGKKIDGADAPVGPFEAKEKSAGWWGIFDAEGNEVGKSIREADAKAFNDMSADDRAAYVTDL